MPLCHLLATRFSSGSCSEQRDFQRLPWNFQSPSPLPKKLLAWIQAVTIISLYQSCLLPKQEVFRLPEECNGFVLSDGAWEVCVRVCACVCVCVCACVRAFVCLGACLKQRYGMEEKEKRGDILLLSGRLFLQRGAKSNEAIFWCERRAA